MTFVGAFLMHARIGKITLPCQLLVARVDIFLMILGCRVFSWPTLPNAREEVINEQLFQAFLVMNICAENSIKRTNEWEKEYESLGNFVLLALRLF